MRITGVLIKGGEAFETLHKITAVIFDKTGTLTLGTYPVTILSTVAPQLIRSVVGKPVVTDVKYLVSAAADGDVPLRFWQLVGAAEAMSEHPLALAVLDKARAVLAAYAKLPSSDTELLSVSDFKVLLSSLSHLLSFSLSFFLSLSLASRTLVLTHTVPMVAYFICLCFW